MLNQRETPPFRVGEEVILGYGTAFSKQIGLLFLLSLLVIFLILEYLRLELGWRIPFFARFIRLKEENKLYGIIFFLLATIISFAAFDYRIALAALLMTTFGDMMAAIIGKNYGSTPICNNKTLAGSLAELITNLIIGLVILTNIYVVLSMAFVATIVETFVDELDDNLVIPIFSGFTGQLITFFL